MPRRRARATSSPQRESLVVVQPGGDRRLGVIDGREHQEMTSRRAEYGAGHEEPIDAESLPIALFQQSSSQLTIPTASATVGRSSSNSRRRRALLSPATAP